MLKQWKIHLEAGAAGEHSVSVPSVPSAFIHHSHFTPSFSCLDAGGSVWLYLCVCAHCVSPEAVPNSDSVNMWVTQWKWFGSKTVESSQLRTEKRLCGSVWVTPLQQWWAAVFRQVNVTTDYMKSHMHTVSLMSFFSSGECNARCNCGRKCPFSELLPFLISSDRRSRRIDGIPQGFDISSSILCDHFSEKGTSVLRCSSAPNWLWLSWRVADSKNENWHSDLKMTLTLGHWTWPILLREYCRFCHMYGPSRAWYNLFVRFVGFFPGDLNCDTCQRV